MIASEADSGEVLLVPVIDVNWLVYAPFDPGRDFRVDPPNVPQSVVDTRMLCGELRILTGGKYVLTPHSGTYCRTGYYEGDMLQVYREAVADGAELAVHLHEEIRGAGTRYTDEAHVTAVFLDCKQRLEAAGIVPVAYRGGHYAYTAFMNRLLPQNGIFIDLSCSPGADHLDREAVWTHAEMSGFYLPEDPRRPVAGQRRSPVFEIPIGSDGEGAAYRNILHIEQSELDNLQRVFTTVRERARRRGTAQIVHCLFHTASVGRPEWLERLRRFLAWAPQNGGRFCGAAEAKAFHDARARAAAA